MTLDTRVYILDPVDPHETFAECRRLIGATERHAYKDGASYKGDGELLLSNDVGQGLPAWLMLHYRKDAPLRTQEQAAEHDDDICNLPEREWYDAESGPCDGTHAWTRACWLTVSFDTAYGYRGENGYGCGDLHAELVAKLGQWLDVRGVRWEWMNEFTGEIHQGYDRLADLGSGGFKASQWFRSAVLPAIASQLGKAI